MNFQASKISLRICVLYICWSGLHLSGQTWIKTPLATSEFSFSSDGAPFLDEFGDPKLALPSNYEPSIIGHSSGLDFLCVDYSMVPDPPLIENSGFPVLGDYFQLNIASYISDSWSLGPPLTDLVEDMGAPSLVSRYDDQVSISYWLGNLLYIDTVATPANQRLSLPILKSQASVCIDQNEGVHVLSVNANYELWHSYYADEVFSQTKISNGPVCDVVTVAGEGDECHVVYSTFSEDTNLNEALDDGEDLNGNSVLDAVPMQLLYQSIDADVASDVDVVIDDTILKLCNFDLHYTEDSGLKVAYADPVQNAIRLATNDLSSWTSEQISTTADMYQSLALAVSADGDCAVSYVSEDRQSLYVVELLIGVWSESLVAESTVGAFFTGTDLAFYNMNDLAILTSEKNVNYLNVYTRSRVPSLLDTLVRPIDIRSAFIVTWPTPSESATSQLLQSNSDLSNPDGWQFIEQRATWRNDSGSAETIVEHENGSHFYRVIEISD